MKKRVTRPKPARAKLRPQPSGAFPVVGIEPSADGLEAVNRLLKDVAQDPGMAYVLVQHLDPLHESALTAVLSRATPMLVKEARDGMAVEPDYVYVIPPNKTMSIENHVLHLLPRNKGGEINPPVDYFFRSLAADRETQVIGIVMSGTGTDGNVGLEEIEAGAAITIVKELRDDLVNLFGRIDIPITMMGDELPIPRFTPQAVQVLKLIPGDIGRPIPVFKLKLPNLLELITEVIESLTVKEQEVQGMDGHWYALRIRACKTADNGINGVVITLQDIDAVKHTLEEVEGACSFAGATITTAREPLIILDADLRMRAANQRFSTCFRTQREETEGKFIHEPGAGGWAEPGLQELLGKVVPEKTSFHDFSIEISLPGLKKKSIVKNARRLAFSAGHPPMILLAMEEVNGKPSPP